MPRGFASFSEEKRRAVASKGGRSSKAPPKIDESELHEARDAVIRAARNWRRAGDSETRLYAIALQARVDEYDRLMTLRSQREEIMGRRTGAGQSLHQARGK